MAFKDRHTENSRVSVFLLLLNRCNRSGNEQAAIQV